MITVLLLHTHITQQSPPSQATGPMLNIRSHCWPPRCSGHHAAASSLFRHPAACLQSSMATLLHTMRVHHLPEPRSQVQAPDLHRAAGLLEGGCQHVDKPILIGRHRLNLQGGNVRARFVLSTRAGLAGRFTSTACQGQEGCKCIDADPLAGRQAGLAKKPLLGPEPQHAKLELGRPHSMGTAPTRQVLTGQEAVGMPHPAAISALRTAERSAQVCSRQGQCCPAAPQKTVHLTCSWPRGAAIRNCRDTADAG